MPLTFRVATFNVENLFSRAKALNLQDHQRIDEILKDVSVLKGLLLKKTYSSGDKADIFKLSNELKDYIEIREDRGKLFTGRGNRRRVGASGADDWDGGIEFKRADISELARESTIKVMKTVKADILCVVEAESRPLLQAFNSKGLKSSKFDYAMLIDGNDDRGIDVGLLSQFEIQSIKTHVYDEDSKGVIFSRDCLEVELRVPGNRSIHVLVNHLKSKGYGSQASSDDKRKRQSVQIARILAEFDLKKDLVIVAGDMNDTPGSGPLSPLLNKQNLFDVLDIQFGSDMTKRWTYEYRNDLNQIDFLLVSKPLKDALVSAGVERRGIYGVKQWTGEDPFATVTKPTAAASDHGAVWAEFSV